jgi:hypothetical protein
MTETPSGTAKPLDIAHPAHNPFDPANQTTFLNKLIETYKLQCSQAS